MFTRILTCFLAAAATACASTPPASTPTLPTSSPTSSSTTASLTLLNTTDDTWHLSWHPDGHATLTPRAEVHLTDLRPGPYTIEAESPRLKLAQTLAIVLRPGAHEVRPIATPITDVSVINPNTYTASLSIDGAPVGDIPPASTARFRVPAGQRLVMLRRADGPGASRDSVLLRPDRETHLTVPALAAALDATRLTPPPGQALLRMRNAGRLAATLWVDQIEFGLIAPDAVVDIVLAPGAHHLEVRIDGLSAKTEHHLDLLPNQVAEWSWSL